MPAAIIVKLAPIWERTTAVIEGTIVNEEGVPIPGSALIALTCTLFVRNAGLDIINGRDHQNVLGTVTTPVNGGLISESGLFQMRLDPADNVIASGEAENHGLVFIWTFLNSGVLETGAVELTLPVKNMSRVPPSPS